jgi:hypothetical protein
MDALIATFVDELKQRVAMYNEDPDGNLFNEISSTEADGKKVFESTYLEIHLLFFICLNDGWSYNII